MKTLSKICVNISAILSVIANISSFLIYAFTIYVAFLGYGFIGGVLALILPVISTIFMAIEMWILNGFFNPFTFSCVLLLLIWGAMFLLYFIGTKLEEKANSMPSEWDNAVEAMERYGMLKTETDREILSYIDKKASEMNITPGEFIKKVKAYEEYQKNNKED